MINRIIATLSISLILFVVVLPIFVIDITIIYFLGGHYRSIMHLLLFLIIFYVINFVLSIVADSFVKVIGEFLEVKLPLIISAVVDFIVSLGIFFALDHYLHFVELSSTIKIVIVLIHTLIILTINTFSKEDTDLPESFEGDEAINSSIEYEIRQILQTENIIDCIDIIRDRHPELSKRTVIVAVRRIHREL